MGTKVYSNQRVTVLAGLASGISDWTDPLLSELLGLTNVSAAVNWNSFDLNIKESDQKDDRTLTDAGGAQSRSPFVNFGGNLQLVHPKPDDTASIFRVAYDIFSTSRVELAVAVRYGPLNTTAAAEGDKWTVYHVIVDPVSFGQNDVSKFYQVNLKARDDIAVDHIIPAASPTTVTKTILDASVTVGDLVFASAAYEGWDITKAATWVSSDETKLVLVHPGIFLSLATGTPTITAKYPGATDSTAGTVTIA